MAAIRVGFEDAHVRVEVPGVAPVSAGAAILLAQFQLFGVVRLRVWIEMRAGKNDLLAVRREIAAGGLADARTDTLRPGGGQIHREYLIKRVPGILFLGLKDDRPAVGRKITLAGPSEIEGELANVFQMNGLILLPGSGGGNGQARDQG